MKTKDLTVGTTGIEACRKIVQILKKKDHTIPEICKELNTTDEFEVISRIADLESMGMVRQKGWNKFYQPDGCVGFVAIYGCAD